MDEYSDRKRRVLSDIDSEILRQHASAPPTSLLRKFDHESLVIEVKRRMPDREVFVNYAGDSLFVHYEADQRAGGVAGPIDLTSDGTLRDGKTGRDVTAADIASDIVDYLTRDSVNEKST